MKKFMLKAALLIACFFPLYATAEPLHVYLKTPNISKDNIIGLNVGIRPLRKTGIRLEPQYIQDKLIIHNYGYGGSGLTQSFGGSQEVMDILSTQKHPSRTVAVLGAGVIGLTTAYDLMAQGYEVRIYADKWSPHLTSNVAAGIWSPLVLTDDASEATKVQNQRVLENAKKRFQKSLGDNPEFAGIRMIDSYSFQSGDGQGAIKTKGHGEDVVVHFDNGVIKNGKVVSEICIDGKVFMQDLFSKVKSRGAHLKEKHFNTVEDILNLEESIIINCTSLGSRELFNDQDLLPVRGQMIYFKPQEGIDYLMYQNVPNSAGTWVSIYPWSDRITLGGVYERGIEEAVIVPETINKIIGNAEKCLKGEL